MPQRPHEHVLETKSIRSFESRLDDWVARRIGADDYGIDMRVEIFTDGRATGREFAVQLKATRNAGGEPSATIRRETLNYWAAQPIPTMLAVWDELTGSLWYEWHHNFPFDSNPGSATKTIRPAQEWCQDTLDEVDEEVQNFQSSRILSVHLPIDLLITGERFYGIDAGRLKTELFRTLQPLSEINVRFDRAGPLHLFVTLEDDGMNVGLAGAGRGRRLTYGNLPDPLPVRDIAGDVAAALAFTVGDRGRAEGLGAKLLARATGQSMMLLASGRVGDAVAILVRNKRKKAVETLMERAFASEKDSYHHQALAGFISAKNEAGPALIRKVSRIMSRAADRWVSPAITYYNAGSILRQTDARSALQLYQKAAEADPQYREREYWWREQGGLHYSLGAFDQSETCYREAVLRGSDRAARLLSDLLTRSGRYREALSLLRDLDLSDDVQDAQWRLLQEALTHVVDDWSIDRQERQQIDYGRQGSSDDPRGRLAAVDAAVRGDALDGWAHWARCPTLAELGEPNLKAHLAAAVFTKDMPQMWDELIRASYSSGRLQLTHDALWCARQYCGEGFVEMVHTDPFLDEPTRKALILMYESLDPVPDDIEVRAPDDAGRMQVMRPGPRPDGQCRAAPTGTVE